jgi:hypothetical protein
MAGHGFTSSYMTLFATDISALDSPVEYIMDCLESYAGELKL